MKTYRMRVTGKGGEILREAFTRDWREARDDATREIEWKLRTGQTFTVDLLNQ